MLRVKKMIGNKPTVQKRKIFLGKVKKKKNWKNICKKVLEESTLHGLPDLVQSRTWFWLIFWGVILTTCASIFVFEVYLVVRDYQAHPLATKTFEEKLTEFQFPPLAVCGKYLFDKDKLEKVGMTRPGRTKDFLLMISNSKYYLWLVRKTPRLKYLFEQFMLGKSLPSKELAEEVVRKEMEKVAKKLNLAPPYRTNLLKHFIRDFNMNKTGYLDYGFQFIYGDIKLKLISSEPIGMKYLGACHLLKFNKTHKIFNGKRSLDLGIWKFLEREDNGGLTVNPIGPILTIGVDFSSETASQNFRQMIHFDRIEQRGDQIEMELWRSRQIRLSTAVAPCDPEGTRHDQAACFLHCDLEEKEKQLNCTPDPWNTKNPNLLECLVMEGEKLPIKLGENSKKCRENCLPACIEDNWSVELKKTGFYRPKALKKKSVPYVSLRVHVKDAFHLIVTEEYVAYTWEMFVGNIGGQAGIWLGASLLSLVQILASCAREACSKR